MKVRIIKLVGQTQNMDRQLAEFEEGVDLYNELLDKLGEDVSASSTLTNDYLHGWLIRFSISLFPSRFYPAEKDIESMPCTNEDYQTDADAPLRPKQILWAQRYLIYTAMDIADNIQANYVLRIRNVMFDYGCLLHKICKHYGYQSNYRFAYDEYAGVSAADMKDLTFDLLTGKANLYQEIELSTLAVFTIRRTIELFVRELLTIESVRYAVDGAVCEQSDSLPIKFIASGIAKKYISLPIRPIELAFIHNWSDRILQTSERSPVFIQRHCASLIYSLVSPTDYRNLNGDIDQSRQRIVRSIDKVIEMFEAFINGDSPGIFGRKVVVRSKKRPTYIKYEEETTEYYNPDK